MTPEQTVPRPDHQAPDYSFAGRAADLTADQLRALADVLDGHSIRILDGVGVDAGQTWLDVAPGAGTITTWLADRVGPHGRVMAVDIDPRYIPEHAGVDVHSADIAEVDLGAAAFDGIHLRLLLMHLSNREAVLRQLVRALRPGAPIVVSDWDCDYRDLVLAAPSAADRALIERFVEVVIAFLVSHGMSNAWSSTCHAALRDAGCRDVVTTTETRSWVGGTGICLLHRTVSHLIEDALLAGGFSEDELHRFRTLMTDDRVVLRGYLMHTTTGRAAG